MWGCSLWPPTISSQSIRWVCFCVRQDLNDGKYFIIRAINLRHQHAEPRLAASSTGPKRVRLQEEGETDKRRRRRVQAGEEAAAGHRLQQSPPGHVHQPGSVIPTGTRIKRIWSRGGFFFETFFLRFHYSSGLRWRPQADQCRKLASSLQSQNPGHPRPVLIQVAQLCREKQHSRATELLQVRPTWPLALYKNNQILLFFSTDFPLSFYKT